MKLINCQTYELNEFFGSEIPAYVILSHTWAEEEVTHNDFISPSGTWRSKKGAQKIIQTCQLGQEHQIQWAWVDTCCIDKSSSAELNEAINSMFEWYRQARVCYIWLSDYDSSSGDLSACKWFTRGWTLQELIASNKRLFYDQDWKCFGAAIRAAPNNTESISPSLVGRNLMQELSEITRIPLDVLHRDLDFAMMKYAVCQKMSWASSRKTTRVEDMAYCLLGIFGINMPMLYGEGGRSFQRLQYEIMKEYNDLSILAWEAPATDSNVLLGRMTSYKTLLAPSPSYFANSWNITQTSQIAPEFAMTNRGLKIETHLVAQTRLHSEAGKDWCLPLHCVRESSGQGSDLPIFIPLREWFPNRFVRTRGRVYLRPEAEILEDVQISGANTTYETRYIITSLGQV